MEDSRDRVNASPSPSVHRVEPDWHDPRLGDVPFGEWADRWLTTKAPKLRPSTVDLYRYLLRRHVVPRFGKAAVGRITGVEVQAWLAELHSTDLSPNTIAKAYRVLSGVMDGAVDARLIARSPCTIKGAGTERHDEMQIATPEQVAALAAAVGPRWEALVFTAAYGGLRWGELAALRRCDIDLAGRTIAVTVRGRRHHFWTIGRWRAGPNRIDRLPTCGCRQQLSESLQGFKVEGRV